MLKTAATLKPGGKRVAETVTSNDVAPKGGGIMRFAYATGSRPLDGYTIKRGIGVGGFGEVYFAVSDAGKEVALKRVQRSMDVELRGVRQCLNLKHANLIALYDIRYDDDGQAWVVMEYVAGESLKDVTERHPDGMPLEDVKHWFRQIAAGVAYLHDHGIVHRDLKPGNIFCDDTVVKIGDYGLSKYISCSRRSGQTESVGTFHYMAPEIGKGVYGKEIDVYALGIILFELLTGRVPFEGESSQEIIMKHLTADPDLSAVPERYRGIIRRAMFKDPEQRFSTVGEMLAAFDACDHSAAAGLNPTSATKPPVRWNPTATQTAERETLYILDDHADHEEIQLGPLKESAPARSPAGRTPVHTAAARSAAGAAARGGATRATETAASRPEPIAHAVRTGWQRFCDWWSQSNLSLPLKVVIILGAALVLIVNSEWLLPLGMVLGAIYVVYFGVYSLVSHTHRAAVHVPPGDHRATAAQPVMDRQQLVARARRQAGRPHRSWQQEARLALSRKYPAERLTELNGSFLMAAVVSGILAFVMLLLSDLPLEGSVYTWSLFGWLTFTCSVGAWSVLAVSKWWEKSDGDEIRRRFVLMIAGLLVGGLAFLGAQFLNLGHSGLLAVNSSDVGTWRNIYDSQGQPGLPVYLIHFGVLMLVLRWWKQADPLRSSRLSLITIGACVLCSWVLSLIWPFPQPWGIMLAAAISIVVQLSSPWINAGQRAQFRRQALEA